MAALEFGPMRRLDPGAVRFLIIHTQGSPSGSDGSAAAIHRYHKAPKPDGRGWSGIGYHAVCRKDGSIEAGRPEAYQGAHVEGLNHCSLGICASGNGDIADFTEAQKQSVAKWIAERMQRYSVPLGNVLGHREVNSIAGVPRTDKPCPGTHVSPRKLRSRVLLELIEHWPEPEVISIPPRLIVPPPGALELEFR